jgi:hypothetical protein
MSLRDLLLPTAGLIQNPEILKKDKTVFLVDKPQGLPLAL